MRPNTTDDRKDNVSYAKLFAYWLCIMLSVYVLYAILLGPVFFLWFCCVDMLSLFETRLIFALVKPIEIVFPQDSYIGQMYFDHYLAWWMELSE
jgi:hypothetical protein